MAHYGKVALSLGILALVGALFIPTMIETTQENHNTTVQIDEGSTQNLSDRLRVSVIEVNGTSEATISYTNTNTYHSKTITLTPGETRNVTLDGEYIESTLNSVSSTGEATIRTKYPPMFGWDDGSKTFINNFVIVIVIIVAVALIGILKILS